MRFNPVKVTFGRHETFALRYSWLTKGFQAVSRPKGDLIFSSDEATVVLGVGKNMVNAIRYWLLAAKLIVPVRTGFEITPLGDKVFGEKGFDPYLEDEATIWLVHWLVSSNPKAATGLYWFFNKFHKPEFTSQEAVSALLEFAKQNIQSKFSVTTVEQDLAVLLRMYVRSKVDARTSIENVLDSPLSLLGLITQPSGGGAYYSRALERESLPVGIFGFSIAQVFKAMGISEVPIENLMYSMGDYPAPGAVFRLTEGAMIAKLERLIHQMPGIFEIRETAGIHQIYLLEKIDPMKFLESHYHGQLQEHSA